MIASGKRTPPSKLWTVAHLASEEPDAVQYLHDDDWDDSTLASTPSVRRLNHLPKNTTTILRHDGEPSEIIIAVDRKLSMPRRLMEKLWRAMRLIIFYFWRKSRSATDGSMASTTQQVDLGENGVLV
mmetsp:Transcript_88031/g.122111  ORF Transcript_88031/g.122111 Transcript_88031/m.122111 type:complete len:127 (+) Transcript_88031:75-455(+)